MPLFTDGPPASIEDLKRYDSSAEELAHDAGIDLDAKLGIGAEEVGQEILEFLLFQASAGYTGSAIWNPALGTQARRGRGIGDVVVTPAVTRWHALKTLEAVYRDGYGSDVTERFRRKLDEYTKLARRAAESAFTAGIGLSAEPVAKAPLPTVVQNSSPADRTDCTIRVTWVRASGREGAPSDAWDAALGAGDVISLGDSAPAGVTGWNLYASPRDGAPGLQNDTPLLIGERWMFLAQALKQGKAPVDYELPDYLVVDRHVLPRG